MNKLICVIAMLAVLQIVGIIATVLPLTQTANAVCSADGRCTGPGGTNSSAGTISPCINHKRTLTASDGRNITQAC
jgi:hypothetical protein